MSVQIRSIVVYGRNGKRREVKFRLGALNVVTGGSRTGKSALLDILDYCWGRDECTVPEGPIRRTVSWYGLVLDVEGEGVLIARRNSLPGERSSDEIYLARGVDEAPIDISSLRKNTTADALKRFLSTALGIGENEHRPPEGQSREPLEANARHAILFCLQAQDEIASRRFLFHRQGEPFLPQAIKDTLVYFLGAVDEDRLRKQLQLDEARRRLRRAERRMIEAQAAAGGDAKARELIDEAKRVGLLGLDEEPQSHAETLSILQRAASHIDPDSDLVVPGDPASDLAELQEERRQLRMKLASVKDEIREAELLLSSATGFDREASEQRARLSAIGLVEDEDVERPVCPVCQSTVSHRPPSVREIQEMLGEITDQLAAVRRENPRVQRRLALLQAQLAEVEDRLRDNQRSTTQRIQESERLQQQQDAFVQRARVAGRIGFYLETAATASGDDGLREQVAQLRTEISELEEVLNPEVVEERVTTALNVVGHYMTDYAKTLSIEHGDYPLRLDRKNLTVVADTLEGPIPLSRMGSGENWVGYHVLAHLGLHRFFRSGKRPVPGFLMLDQPSQSNYPSELDQEGELSILGDEDRAAVHRIFDLLRDFTEELAPNMQVIVVDHVDIKEPWFQDAIAARWRRGEKLIPEEWITP